jgi:hypothetical protein
MQRIHATGDKNNCVHAVRKVRDANRGCSLCPLYAGTPAMQNGFWIPLTERACCRAEKSKAPPPGNAIFLSCQRSPGR